MMTKRLLLVVALITAASWPGAGQAQEAATPVQLDELRVRENETHTITAQHRNIHVNHWIMEDNSTIEIAADVAIWTLRAGEADIGNGVTIIGRGRSGNRGFQNQGNPGPLHDRCSPAGNPGHNAGHGAPGTPGSSVEITAGIASLGGLTFDLAGGPGGNGGRGGPGGRGGDGSCGRDCHGRAGGNGGVGGSAGAGGAGGDATLHVWPVGDSPLAINAFTFNLDGGPAGTPGTGGAGGSGGAGSSCVFSDKRPGPNGGNGPVGGSAQPGSRGNSAISIIPRPDY